MLLGVFRTWCAERIRHRRRGAGTNYGTNGFIKPGVYTIVEEQDGQGATKWGKLKSGAGWISLDFVQKL